MDGVSNTVVKSAHNSVKKRTNKLVCTNYAMIIFGSILFSTILHVTICSTREKSFFFNTGTIASSKLQSRPFSLEMEGQQFTKSLPNYGQKSNYRPRPNSVQDIILFLRDHSLNRVEKKVDDKLSPNPIRTDNNGFRNDDPFQYYKPNDPSDINLLAMASFRFAPPAWKSFKNVHKSSTFTNLNQGEELLEKPHKRDEIVKKIPEEFVINFNVYPMIRDNHIDLLKSMWMNFSKHDIA